MRLADNIILQAPILPQPSHMMSDSEGEMACLCIGGKYKIMKHLRDTNDIEHMRSMTKTKSTRIVAQNVFGPHSHTIGNKLPVEHTQ